MGKLRVGFLALALVVAAACTGESESDSFLPRVRAVDRHFEDPDGRTVVFHGTNMVSKTEQSPAQAGFDEDDAKVLQAAGMNVVRLGVIWANVEPNPGEYDDDYVDSLRQTADMLGGHGIYTLVDFHQDEFSQLYGDGAPGWATLGGGTHEPDCGFPVNLYAPNCRTDINNSYDAFWRNDQVDGKGLWDYYARMTAHVAGRLNSLAGTILGYEIMNEPFPGTEWSKCMKIGPPLDFSMGCAEFEQGPLAGMYRTVFPLLRAAAQDATIFFEPNVFVDLGAPIDLPSFDVANSALAYHDYQANPPDPYEIPIRNAAAYTSEHNVPALVTEFGATSDPAALTAAADVFDENMVSWIHWTYFNNAAFKFAPPVGNESPPDPQAQSIVTSLAKPLTSTDFNPGVLEALTRVYPQAIAGTPTAFAYDPATRVFTLTYAPSSGTTRVAVPASLYPDGYASTAVGGEVTSEAGATLLTVETDSGADVTLTVRPS